MKEQGSGGGLWQAFSEACMRSLRTQLQAVVPTALWKDTDDLVQDALLEAFRHRGSFHGSRPEELQKWIVAFGLHIAQHTQRKEATRAVLPLAELGPVELRQFTEALAANPVTPTGSTKALLEESISCHLREPDATLVRLHYLAEVPVPDAARAVGLGTRAAYARLHHAIDILRVQLREAEWWNL